MRTCFAWLDMPVDVLGALDLPAVPLNTGLESAMLPGPGKVIHRLSTLLEG
jgi:2-oxoisovalerate dehydrogenase E1 component